MLPATIFQLIIILRVLPIRATSSLAALRPHTTRLRQILPVLPHFLNGLVAVFFGVRCHDEAVGEPASVIPDRLQLSLRQGLALKQLLDIRLRALQPHLLQIPHRILILHRAHKFAAHEHLLAGIGAA